MLNNGTLMKLFPKKFKKNMNNLRSSKKFLMLALVEKLFYFTNLTFLFNIFKTKPLTLTFKETNGTLVVKTVRKLYELY